MAKQTFTTGQVLTAAQMTSLQQTAMGGGSASTKTTSYVLVAADAGTTIQMNAAGATTITVNTALFAAGDLVFIQNIGAGTCTITPGSATCTTSGSLALGQWEGGQLYFTSASASIFFDYTQTGSVSPLTTKGDVYTYSTLDARLAVGTNGQVLTAASGQATGLQWAAPAASTNVWTLLSTTTLSTLSSNTVTISGLTSENILVTIIGASIAGATAYYYVTPTVGTNTGSNGLALQRTGTATMLGGDEAGSVSIAGTSNTTSLVYGYAMFTGCKSTTGAKTAIGGGGSDATNANDKSYVSGGIIMATAALTAITFANTGGNFTAGTLRIYGA